MWGRSAAMVSNTKYFCRGQKSKCSEQTGEGKTWIQPCFLENQKHRRVQLLEWNKTISEGNKDKS